MTVRLFAILLVCNCSSQNSTVATLEIKLKRKIIEHEIATGKGQQYALHANINKAKVVET